MNSGCRPAAAAFHAVASHYEIVPLPQNRRWKPSCVDRGLLRASRTGSASSALEVRMGWLTSKTAIVGGCLAVVGLQGYGLMSVRGALEDRVSSLEMEVQRVQIRDNAKISQLASDLDVVTHRIGITAQELQQAYAIADQLKQDNARTA